MKYLLDTNICIYLFKGQFDIDKRIKEVGFHNCAISEISYADLVYGAEKSQYPEKNYLIIEQFTDQVSILPIFNAIRVYAKEKVRLQKRGQVISDFDILIGATAIANNLVMVTRNVSEFERLEKIKIENWSST